VHWQIIHKRNEPNLARTQRANLENFWDPVFVLEWPFSGISLFEYHVASDIFFPQNMATFALMGGGGLFFPQKNPIVHFAKLDSLISPPPH